MKKEDINIYKYEDFVLNIEDKKKINAIIKNYYSNLNIRIWYQQQKSINIRKHKKDGKITISSCTNV